jgi:putative hydroxymethylpyrimidine transport system substrate-binding protein
VVLAACGSKQDTLSASGAKPFAVMLDFFPNADHAALYSAIANGYFKTVGLDVRPETPSDPSTPLKLLAAGRVDMAISYEPELLLARDQGLKLVSVGALVQRPLTSIIALPRAHVRKVADLAGKRVGTAGIGYQAAELRTALRAAGVSPSAVQEANVGFNLVPAMLSGKVAATLGGFWNYEALQLQQMRKHPVVIPVDRAGVPTYDELVLVVREDEAGTGGQDLRAFLQALTLGERQVRSDPAAAAALIVKANPSAERKLQLASIEATLPAMLPADRSKPYGWQDPAAWAAFGRWMLSRGLIRSNPNRASLPPFTNEFLPGQGI